MPTGCSQNQTQSFLLKRFREVGIRPNTRHGQNFLIDLNLARLLVDTARIQPHDVVLEVGTGTGSLTALMAPLAAAVVTVEIDEQLHQLASEELIDFPNVTMLLQDALKSKNTLAPEVLSEVLARLAERPNRQFKLVANLPYNVATPILSNLLAADVVPRTMTVTIQKELADRIVAHPSTKDYSALSIWIQSQCQAAIVRVMPPSAFWPRPKVTSAILHLQVRDELRRRIPDLAFFHTFIRSLFFHRRKFLRSVLLSAFKGQLTKPQADEILVQLNLRPDCRAEQLDIETMLALSEAVQARVQEV